jgi:hypothetical protein
MRTSRNLFWSVVIVVGILLLLSIRACTHSQQKQLEGQIKNLKEQVDVAKDGVTVAEEKRLKEKDSFTKIIEDLKSKNKRLDQSIVSLKGQIKQKKNFVPKTPKNTQGLAKYFNERYDTNKTVATNTSVNLDLDTGVSVTYDLEEYDNCLAVDSLKTQVIEKQDAKINNLEKETVLQSSMLQSAEEEINKRKEYEALLEQLNHSQTKQIRKMKVKGVLNTIILPVLGAAGGFIIGKNL